jgi:hypothetical protein
MGSHEDDAAYKGRLRSIWTHTVDISRLQGQQQQSQQQQHGRAHSQPGSPSKAFISSAQAQALLPGMRTPGGWCFLGRLDREVRGAAALQSQLLGCSMQCMQLARVQAPATAAVTCDNMRVTTCISWKWSLFEA